MSQTAVERALVIGLMLAVIAIASAGQLLLKAGLRQALSGQRIQAAVDYLHIFTNPVVLLGLCCYAANLFLYLFVISRARLGFAYPLIALNYALVSVLAWRFFDEPISRQQSVGLAIIILGVVVFATQPEPAKAHAVEPAAEQSLASPAGR